jgi:hypothetical protein
MNIYSVKNKINNNLQIILFSFDISITFIKSIKFELF